MNSEKNGYLFENLRKIISLVDQMRDIGLQQYISLPRVVVLGTQSAGKSSLLEQIVGLDFLPRGTGVVTRRPLELRLVHVPKASLDRPYGIFEEIPNKKFIDFEEVKQNIDILTDKIAGKNKGIIDKPIVLTIYSNTCPDLTLVDLPGITRIPLQGSDQNEDIEKVTKDMARRYCSDPKTIILCVLASNQDITIQDGLLMAQQLDVQGDRTIGVLTKVDIMDQGTDVKKILLGQEVPLKLGYVAIAGRSAKDIAEKKPVLKHLDSEKSFFAHHPTYSTLNNDLLGTESLTKKVTEVFYKHVRTFLPRVDQEMSKILSEKQARLDMLGQPLPQSDNERLQYLWKLTNEFINHYKTSIQGTYSKNFKLKSNQLPIGSQIRQILTNLYSDFDKKRACDQYTDLDIKRAMQFHEGDSIPGFPSIDSFLSLLVPLLKQLADPAQDCINDVYYILEELAVEILDQQLLKLPQLKQELQEGILSAIQAEREKTKEIVKDLIDSEINYIFTNDEGYMKNTNNKINTNKDHDHSQNLTIVHELRNRIDSYFKVVLRSVRDSIPKHIGSFLVKTSQEKLRFTLFEMINKSNHYFKYMQEPTHIMEERKELNKVVYTMRKAKQAIRKDPDLSFIYQEKKQMKPKEHHSVSHHHNQHSSNQSSHQSSQHSSHNRSTHNTSHSTHSQSTQHSNQQQDRHSQQQRQDQKQQPTNPEQEKLMRDMFGVRGSQPNPAQQNTSQHSKQDMFQRQAPISQQGNQNPNNNIPNQQMNRQQQQQQPPQQGKVDNAIDKGVDKMFQNDKFQNNMKNAANKGMYAAVDSQVPMKGKDGSNPIANFMGKQAEKAVANDKVQEQMKNQMKDQTKDQVKQKRSLF